MTTTFYSGIWFTSNPKMLIDGKPNPDLYVTDRDESNRVTAMMGHPETVRKVTEYRPRPEVGRE